MGEDLKQVIVVSAINFTVGGPLSILQDCLSYLQANCLDDYRVVALVHDKNLLDNVDGIETIEYPKSVRSYFYRMFYEYFYFNKLSKVLKPYLWLSLHDMTPVVKADIRVVYCHNPAPFYKLRLNQMLLEPTFTLFNIFYRYIYKINIKKNDYVIVQQNWLRTTFKNIYQINSVVVAYPNIQELQVAPVVYSKKQYQFFFPTLPRFFKNIEVIIDAVRILNERKGNKCDVIITIDGTENKYARQLVDDSEHIENINFIGRVAREKVFELYGQSDCLIFPSKLETWGLPITEFKQFNKPMLVADLPYAHETVGNYQQVCFFDPEKPSVLADMMQNLVDENILFSGNKAAQVEDPFTQSWAELFDLLLKKVH
jgi:glycosyltransferase involved in cell wall biosynthesis